MSKRKNIRKRGKISFSRAFQEFKKGDSVAIAREPAMQPIFPKRIQGRTGIIKEKRGKSYIIKLKDLKKEKIFIINPIHLKKIKQIERIQ